MPSPLFNPHAERTDKKRLHPQASKVEFTEKELTLSEAQFTDLSQLLTITPVEAKHYIAYTVKDEKVAKVTKEGILTAVSAGTTKVTVMLDNNKRYSATLTLTVEARPLTMEISSDAQDGMAGEDAAVTWTVTPGFTEGVTFDYVLTKNDEEIKKTDDSAETSFKANMQGAGVYKLTVTAKDGIRETTVTDIVRVAGTTVSGDFTFRIAGETVAVTGYTGTAANVTVPATLGGADVTEIGADAFAGNTTLTSVSLPNKIKTIGARAFKGCTKLASVNPY